MRAAPLEHTHTFHQRNQAHFLRSAAHTRNAMADATHTVILSCQPIPTADIDLDMYLGICHADRAAHAGVRRCYRCCRLAARSSTAYNCAGRRGCRYGKLASTGMRRAAGVARQRRKYAGNPRVLRARGGLESGPAAAALAAAAASAAPPCIPPAHPAVRAAPSSPPPPPTPSRRRPRRHREPPRACGRRPRSCNRPGSGCGPGPGVTVLFPAGSRGGGITDCAGAWVATAPQHAARGGQPQHEVPQRRPGAGESIRNETTGLSWHCRRTRSWRNRTAWDRPR
jgi:hypothetical protein